MAQDVERAQQRLRQAESLVRFAESGLASGSTNQNELRIAQSKYEAARLDLFDAEKAAAGTPPENSAPASNPTPEPPPINTRVEQPETPSGISDAISPAANQADAPGRTSRRQRAQAQRSAQQDPEVVQQESVEDTSFSVFNPSTWFGNDDEDVTTESPYPEFSEFSDLPADVSVPPAPTEDPPVNQSTDRRARAQAARVREREPEDPTQDAEVNEQQSNRDRAQAQRIENAAPADVFASQSPAAARVDSTVSRRAQAQIIRHDRIVASDPTSYESLTDEQLRAQTASTQAALNSLLALPTQERLRVQTQIDALENQLDLLDQETARRVTRGRLEDQVASGKRAPEPVDDQEAKDQDLVPKEEEIDFADEFDTGDEVRAAEARNAALENLKAQKAITQERSPEAEGDWRVKLRLASGSTYLYKMAQNAGVVGNAGQPFDVGILAPLVPTDGIIFPYTPRISTLYQADYNTYSPTHSNYNAYWYKGSRVGEVQIDATFTAQDTNEANYLLAVIHFLKSASKMFYGQDPNRGSPPPLLFLSGLGTYQYNEHPCVITQFNYILPDDVDYIRAGSYQLDGNAAATQANIRNRNASNGPSWAGSTARRLMNGLPEGAEPRKPSGSINLSDSNATYVPTKMAINIVLLPVNNRLQVSQNFSLQEYGNGRLLTGGMW